MNLAAVVVSAAAGARRRKNQRKLKVVGLLPALVSTNVPLANLNAALVRSHLAIAVPAVLAAELVNIF